jgi:hypothetical protein
LDLEPQPKTAARRWAEAYYKATSRSIRIYCDKAQRETFADLRYTEWLEDQLETFADLRYTEWLEDQLEKVVAAAREARSTFKENSPIFCPRCGNAHDASIMCQPGEGDKG